MVIRLHSVEVQTDFFTCDSGQYVDVANALFDAGLDDATIYTKGDGRICFDVTRDASYINEVVDSIRLDLDKVKGFDIEIESWKRIEDAL